jgi:hypothetical protein
MSTNRTDVIRSAIACGDFVEARRLWEIYAEDLQQAIVAGRCTADMMTEAGDLIEWAKLNAQSLRMHGLSRIYEARATEAFAKSLL